MLIHIIIFVVVGSEGYSEIMDKLNLDAIFNTNINWQMSLAERASILHLMQNMSKRSVAIEIGSYQGGLLQHLTSYFNKVYSLDVDHSNIKNKEQYKNVTWVKGDSKITIPQLISDINNNDEDVNFILIDANHDYAPVLEDIHNVLQYKPKSETWLLIHDSWYSQTRNAISKTNWNDNKYVHLVEKDFVVGDVMNHSQEGIIFVGGLALVYINVNKRIEDIQIKQSHDYMYKIFRNKLSVK